MILEENILTIYTNYVRIFDIILIDKKIHYCIIITHFKWYNPLVNHRS